MIDSAIKDTIARAYISIVASQNRICFDDYKGMLADSAGSDGAIFDLERKKRLGECYELQIKCTSPSSQTMYQEDLAYLYYSHNELSSYFPKKDYFLLILVLPNENICKIENIAVINHVYTDNIKALLLQGHAYLIPMSEVLEVERVQRPVQNAKDKNKTYNVKFAKIIKSDYLLTSDLLKKIVFNDGKLQAMNL